MRHRLLAVDVFACLDRIHHDLSVVVVGHGDDDTVDVATIEQILITRGRRQAGVVGQLPGQRVTAIVQIRGSDALDPREAESVRKQARALHADTMIPKRTVSLGATGFDIAAKASVSSAMPLLASNPPVANAPVWTNSLRESLLNICFISLPDHVELVRGGRLSLEAAGTPAGPEPGCDDRGCVDAEGSGRCHHSSDSYGAELTSARCRRAKMTVQTFGRCPCISPLRGHGRDADHGVSSALHAAVVTCSVLGDRMVRSGRRPVRASARRQSGSPNSLEGF